MKKLSKALAVAAVAVSAAYMPAASAAPVKLELALLVDTSGSVNDQEYALQKGGYVNAFQSAAIHNLIAGAAGGIAVTYIEWSGGSEQSQRVGWTHLTNAAESNAFAAAISGLVGRPFSGLTAPGSAINFAAPLFTNNNFEGGQTVNDYTRANEGRIMGDIAPYVVRITQREAGITTEIQEQVHVVPMSDRTRRLMRRIAKDGVVGRLGLRQVLADTGASRMVKLRQLAGGTVKWERQRVGGDGVLTAPEGGSTCFDRSKVDYIQRTFTGKTAILYTFIAEGDMLREAYGDRASDSPEEFNADPSKVFIGQVQSSREGVNLSSADDIVFYGIDYAALSYLQARDRASYIGRTRANRGHWIFAEGSLEPMVFRVVKNKESYTVKHYNRDAGKLGATQDHQADGEGGLDGHQDHPGEHGGASRPVVAARGGGPVGGGQTAGEEAHRLAIRAARAVAADRIQR